MATLARLFDFTPGTVIASQEVDSEFNQLVEILNGTTVNKQAFIQLSDAALATLKLNQVVSTANSIIQSWLAGGTEKSRVDGLGRFRSLIPRISTDPAAAVLAANANAPMVVASTSLVRNLNADMVDGLHASDLESALLGTFTSNITISNTQPTLTFEDTTPGEDDMRFVLRNDGTDQILTLERVSDSQAVQRWNVDFATSQFHDIVSLRQTDGTDVDITVAVGGSNPDQHLTPKLYVDSKTVAWSISAYFDGSIQVSQPTGQWIAPESINDFIATHIRAVFVQGTLTGSTTVQIIRTPSGGSPAVIGTVILLSSATPGEVVGVTVSPNVEFVASDLISWNVTTAGGHESVSVALSGNQKVKVN